MDRAAENRELPSLFDTEGTYGNGMEAAVPEVRELPLLSTQVVQGEWDQTLNRLRELCEITSVSAQVSTAQVAYLSVKRTPEMNLEGIERILFQNLTFAPWSRTVREHEVFFGGQWLFRWRKAVPFTAVKVGGMSRLAPDVPQHQWTYRYNVIEVEP